MQSYLKTGKLASTITSDSKPGSSKVTKKPQRPIPWVEKYRPRTVDDVVEQGEVVAVLRQCLAGADLPNLLLYGPPGTGKTSTILAAAHQLFGDIFKDRILELNASDERGIQVIRDKVKSFSQLTASGVRPDGRPCPTFKIVILDEADSMTHAAQAALRRTMEKQTRTTRFCLVCNYVSRIIEPLTSRCTKFRFKPLGEEKIIERLELISKEEGLKVSGETLKTLVSATGGDMRRAITSLQSCSKLKGKETQLQPEDILEVMGLIGILIPIPRDCRHRHDVSIHNKFYDLICEAQTLLRIVPDHWVDGLLNVCEVDDYYKWLEYLDKFILEGYSATQLLEQVHQKIVFSPRLTDKQKSLICEKLAVCLTRLQEGASEFLQMADLCCRIAAALKTL